MAEAATERRALYLRWRPTSFADVVGQEHVVRTLRNAVISGTPAHAYLFSGPRGTGKTSVARILFRAVNCVDPQSGDPCGECAVCVAALGGRDPHDGDVVRGVHFFFAAAFFFVAVLAGGAATVFVFGFSPVRKAST